MAPSEDLINFDLIETHKENIQTLPGGRSAKQLVSILSPAPSAKSGSEPTLNETKTLNDAIRQEYENELLSIADSDDPLDIYDRYVKWTLNAYPSAQATPQSQLLPLLERATKTFLTSAHYKNDPRYLKLWLHYIRLFSDSPRETFAFLARHHIGETLGLFYEEFAAWLESADRWNQADEVYQLGIEREARPVERLMRKYNQFQQRFEARPQDANEPSSPALPTVRPALAAKMDPFATTARTEELQGQRSGSNTSAVKSKSGKPKMAIFNDADSQGPPVATSNTKGWDSIGSMRERKKENAIEARPWTGETLKAGKRVGGVPKMEIFKDPTIQIKELPKAPISTSKDIVNPKTGRSERVYVQLEAVYPNETEEYSFEELRAMRRGWMDQNWKRRDERVEQMLSVDEKEQHQAYKPMEPFDIGNLTHGFQEKVVLQESSPQSSLELLDLKSGKPRRTKHREVKQETQTVKTRLDSPTGKKVKRKVQASTEPTMTFHSKAAMNDIYNIFNHSQRDTKSEHDQSEDEADEDEDIHSIAGESVGTDHLSGNNSEFGDDTTRSFGLENTGSQPDSGSPWSDLTLSGRTPKTKSQARSRRQKNYSDDLTGEFDSSQNQTMGGFDTQAIAALANQDFGDLDTKMIAHLAGDMGSEHDDEDEEQEQDLVDREPAAHSNDRQTRPEEVKPDTQDLKTPTEELFDEQVEIQEKSRFVPIPPEDYEPTPLRPYRDPIAVAHNKLPFMTPIVERTESSMAPSTVFQNPEYFFAKTPSKSEFAGAQHNTKSDLQIENLLLSSPIQDSPSSSKRRRPTETELKSDEIISSSTKMFDGDSLVREQQSLPLVVAEPIPTLVACDLSEEITPSQEVGSATVIPLKVNESTKSKPIHKGPIILDLQCNPCDEAVRQQILENVYPSVSTYQGYTDSSDQDFNHHNVLKAFVTKQKKEGVKSSPKKNGNEKTLTKAMPPVLRFNSTQRIYAVKRELGKGAYAPVYLVDSYSLDEAQDSPPACTSEDVARPQSPSSRDGLVALKTESPPLSLVWEFHILHLARSRLGDASRAMSSIIKAQECHLYRDECYLVLDYHSQGTLLDLVNSVRAENSRAGKTAEGLEETIAMWLSVELLRTMDELWKVGLLHGDLKIDNCLVRFDPTVEVSAPYSRDGACGWASKGFTLIDFGRGIDTRAFKSEARFVADWKAEETDCAEIREARPWKFEIDLFGAAGIIHSLLFGKYIETVAAGGGGLGQRKDWKLRDSLKRYWERDIWGDVFGLLINGGKFGNSEEVRSEVQRVRKVMEDWLENEGERGGRDLRGALRRCERLVKSR